MLIENKPSCKNSLKGKVVLITGAGGGIGYEAAKAFAYMGAVIIIAEICEEKGAYAVQTIHNDFPTAKVELYLIDLSEENQVNEMYSYIIKKYGFVDILLHNATMIAMGNVEEVPIAIWDKSYRVNFKAPLLLTQLFLPHMKKRDTGIIVFVSSSGAAPYMGAYEVFKTSQVELCNTLCGELENTNIYTYAIGPGLVKTDTAMKGIEVVADKMGISTETFYAMNDKHILSAEEAGCGFAVSVLLAEKYNGQEIGSIQALVDSELIHNSKQETISTFDEIALSLVHKIITIYIEQYNGWMARNVFERQWVLRDFKKTVGMSAEQCKIDLERLRSELQRADIINLSLYKNHFVKLKEYFIRQHKLLQGFEKNPDKLKENSAILEQWINDLNKIVENIRAK